MSAAEQNDQSQNDQNPVTEGIRADLIGLVTSNIFFHNIENNASKAPYALIIGAVEEPYPDSDKTRKTVMNGHVHGDPVLALHDAVGKNTVGAVLDITDARIQSEISKFRGEPRLDKDGKEIWEHIYVVEGSTGDIQLVEAGQEPAPKADSGGNGAGNGGGRGRSSGGRSSGGQSSGGQSSGGTSGGGAGRGGNGAGRSGGSSRGGGRSR